MVQKGGKERGSECIGALKSEACQPEGLEAGTVEFPGTREALSSISPSHPFLLCFRFLFSLTLAFLSNCLLLASCVILQAMLTG